MLRVSSPPSLKVYEGPIMRWPLADHGVPNHVSNVLHTPPGALPHVVKKSNTIGGYFRRQIPIDVSKPLCDPLVPECRPNRPPTEPAYVPKYIKRFPDKYGNHVDLIVQGDVSGGLHNARTQYSHTNKWLLRVRETIDNLTHIWYQKVSTIFIYDART